MGSMNMGSCGGGASDCGCGGSCGGGGSSPSETSGHDPNDPPVGAPEPSGSCGGSCDGQCDDCQGSKRVTGLNWGRLQASSNLGMSNFWREATIGDSFARTTGEIFPPPLLRA